MGDVGSNFVYLCIAWVALIESFTFPSAQVLVTFLAGGSMEQSNICNTGDLEVLRSYNLDF